MDNYLIIIYAVGYLGFLFRAILKYGDFKENGFKGHVKFFALCIAISTAWPVIVTASIFNRIIID